MQTKSNAERTTAAVPSWTFDREGRIAGWQVPEGDGLTCHDCAQDTDGDPVTMEAAGEGARCVRCGERIA